MKKRNIAISSIIGAVALALVLPFSAQAAPTTAAAPPNTATAAVVSLLAVDAPAPSSVAQPALIQWTPYDYAHITTYQKCLNRMNYLKSVNPDFTYWRCMDYLQPQCPTPIQYWMVEVGTNNYIVAPPVSLSSLTREPAVAAC